MEHELMEVSPVEILAELSLNWKLTVYKSLHWSNRDGLEVGHCQT